MAESKRKKEPIIKGMQLTILVEEVVNGVLVVLLEHEDLIFRGVLLDAKQRNGPCNAYTSLQHPDTDNDRVKTEQDIHNHQADVNVDSKPVDLPATVFRHTYFQNTSPFKTMGTSEQIQPFPKIGGNKQTRNIRLRPRQTLCSNCKSTCLDSGKGPIPVTSAMGSQNHSNQFSSTRQHNSLPQNSSKSILNKLDCKNTHSRKRQKELDNELKPTKLIKVHNEPPKLTRTSPFIKISIGETNVMNIPPRLQESDKDELSSEAEKCTDMEDSANITTALHNEEDDDDEDNEVIFNFKPSLQRQRQEEKMNLGENRTTKSSSYNHRKSRRPKHKQDSDSELPNIIITENIDSEDEKSESSQNSNASRRRPRLVYTLHQRKGLSNVNETGSDSDGEKVHSSTEMSSSRYENLDGTSIQEPSSNYTYKSDKKRSRKRYKLRSRSRSADSNPEYELSKDSSSSFDEQKSVSGQSDGCSTSGSDSSEYGDGPPGDDNTDCLKPIMMKIHTTSMSKCSTADGRKLHVEDIVWGKVKGFPWWPGRVMTINVSQKDNGVVIRQIAHVAWFGSSTMSHIPCSDLYPFLEDFKVRFNRKKKSTPYRRAIKQATIAAQSCSAGENIDFNDIDFSCIG